MRGTLTCIDQVDLTRPTPLTDLIGRDQDVISVTAALGSGRLVTLVGPAGIGKTRLALAVASGCDSIGGPVFVDLSPVSTRHLVLPCIAASIGLRQQPGIPFVDLVANWVGDRPQLVVLDNCEHLLAPVAQLLEGLLEACPTVRILATSREPLGLGIEVVHHVAPLDLPTEGNQIAQRNSTAVQLLCARVTAADPAFQLTDDTLPAVAEICRRLDGIPLAIELAASRFSFMSPQKIATVLAERLKVIDGGDRRGPARHRTLGAALDWSYDLFADDEKAVLRRAAFFVGGFRADAVGDDAILSVLVKRSMVISNHDRFRLLEPIRQYAQMKADELGETAHLRDLHAAWCVDFAEGRSARVNSAGHRAAVAGLDREHDNIRAALAWLVESRQADAALGLASAMAMYWGLRGTLTEGRSILEAALALEESRQPSRRLRALWSAAYLACEAGDFLEASWILQDTIRLADSVDDPAALARAWALLAHCHQFISRIERVEVLEHYERAAELSGRVDDQWSLAHARAGTAHMHYLAGDAPLARSILQECVQNARQAKVYDGVLYASELLANVVLGVGDRLLAEAVLAEALDLALDLEILPAAVSIRCALGDLLLEKGATSGAREAFQHALHQSTAAGLVQGIVMSSCGVAELNRREDRLAEAKELFGHATRLATEVGRRQGTTGYSDKALLGSAQVALAEHDPWTARPLLDVALRRSRETSDLVVVAGALHELSRLSRVNLDEDLALTQAMDAWRGWTASFHIEGRAWAADAVAGLNALAGRFEVAVTIFGAVERYREDSQCPEPFPAEARWRDADRDLVRSQLKAPTLEKAWEAGRSMGLDQVIAWSTGRRDRPRTGWAALSAAERRVCSLAATGMGNTDIGTALAVTNPTVKTHFRNAFAKLGITTRLELDRLIELRQAAVNPLGLPRIPDF